MGLESHSYTVFFSPGVHPSAMDNMFFDGNVYESSGVGKWNLRLG